MSKAADLARTASASETALSNRNLMINGDMQVAQRGADINSVANGGFCTDRFKISYANTDNLVLNLDQSTDTPAGFSSSLKLSVGTVESALAADEYLQFGQKIEAQNLQQLIYGTSSAKTLTLSFWVKSSATGTYAVSIFQSDATKYYSTTYTINSANTWEYKTVEINGNVSNVITNDNGEGLRVNWTLSAGTNYTSGSNGAWGAITNWSVGHNVSWITTSGATFFITGVQLEVGTVATPFEHRSVGQELFLCERYFQSLVNGELVGSKNTAARMRITAKLEPEMRAVPTVTRTSTNVVFQGVAESMTSTSTASAQAANSGTKCMAFDLAGFSSLAARSYGGADSNPTIPVFNCDAEL